MTLKVKSLTSKLFLRSICGVKAHIESGRLVSIELKLDNGDVLTFSAPHDFDNECNRELEVEYASE